MNQESNLGNSPWSPQLRPMMQNRMQILRSTRTVTSDGTGNIYQVRVPEEISWDPNRFMYYFTANGFVDGSGRAIVAADDLEKKEKKPIHNFFNNLTLTRDE